MAARDQGNFALDGATALWVAEGEDGPTRMAAGCLAGDLEKITGTRPDVKTGLPENGQAAVVIASADNPRAADFLKQCGAPVDQIAGQWESYLFKRHGNVIVIAGADARYAGSLSATRLKVANWPVFSMGDVGAWELPDLAHAHTHAADGVYRKLVVSRGRLIGALALGEWAALSRVQEAVQATGAAQRRTPDPDLPLDRIQKRVRSRVQIDVRRDLVRPGGRDQVVEHRAARRGGGDEKSGEDDGRTQTHARSTSPLRDGPAAVCSFWNLWSGARRCQKARRSW